MLGRTIPAEIPGVVLALPFVGGCYSFAARLATPEVERRFRGGRWYGRHDLAILALSGVAGVLVGRSV